jgi:hypothetical protein
MLEKNLRSPSVPYFVKRYLYELFRTINKFPDDELASTVSADTNPCAYCTDHGSLFEILFPDCWPSYAFGYKTIKKNTRTRRPMIRNGALFFRLVITSFRVHNLASALEGLLRSRELWSAAQWCGPRREIVFNTIFHDQVRVGRL